MLDAEYDAKAEEFHVKSLAIKAMDVLLAEYDKYDEHLIKKRIEAQAPHLLEERMFREARGREILATTTPQPDPPTIPVEIQTALSGSRRQYSLFHFLWDNQGEYVDWGAIGNAVWADGGTDIATMERTAQRLNTKLLVMNPPLYYVEHSAQAGAALFPVTNSGQTSDKPVVA